MILFLLFPFLFFNDTATTEIYTLSLHDALPIFGLGRRFRRGFRTSPFRQRRSTDRSCPGEAEQERSDRKSTRLNSSHTVISYAVFCLKKKKKKKFYKHK